MNDYYQYVIRVRGELKWFFGTSDNIALKDITIEKIKGLDIPTNTTKRLKSEDKN